MTADEARRALERDFECLTFVCYGQKRKLAALRRMMRLAEEWVKAAKLGMLDEVWPDSTVLEHWSDYTGLHAVNCPACKKDSLRAKIEAE